MKRTVKKLFAFIVSVVILSSALIFNTSAAGTIIAFSKKTLTVGDTLSVTVSIDAGAPMYGVMCNVNYNSTVLEYKSGVGAGGAGSVRIVESPSGETKVSYTLTFNAIKSGSSAISVSDVIASVQSDNGSVEKGLSSASANVTVNDASLSANANLSSLSLSAGRLSPKFNQNTTSYTVTVKNSVTSCNLYATAADSGAKVSVSDSSALKIGKNVRTVTVTAPSGAQKVYTITINRSEEEKLVSSEQSSSEDEENDLTTTIEGVEYTVATDISNEKLFKGFTVSTAKFNEQDVAVAVDSMNNYKIYFLKGKDSDELKPYTLDETNNNFTLPQGDLYGMIQKMVNKRQLIYKDDARKAVLKASPSSVWCIDNIKPVNAVEVVRCDQCRFHSYSISNLWCDIFDKIMPEDGYCCFGERKDNG